MNKQIKWYYNQIKNHRYYDSLYDCYNNPSQAKLDGYNTCIDVVYDVCGEVVCNYGILSYNTFMFTMFVETVKHYYIFTPSHTFKIDKVTLKVKKLA